MVFVVEISADSADRLKKRTVVQKKKPGGTKDNLRLGAMSCHRIAQATGSTDEPWSNPRQETISCLSVAAQEIGTGERKNRWNRSKQPPGRDHSLGFPSKKATTDLVANVMQDSCLCENSNGESYAFFPFGEQSKDIPKSLPNPITESLPVIQEYDVWQTDQHDEIQTNNPQIQCERPDPRQFTRSLYWNSLFTGDDPWVEN